MSATFDPITLTKISLTTAFLDACLVGLRTVEPNFNGDTKSSICLLSESTLFVFVFCCLDDDDALDEDDILLLDKEDTESDRCICAKLGDGDEKLNARSLELVLSFIV